MEQYKRVLKEIDEAIMLWETQKGMGHGLVEGLLIARKIVTTLMKTENKRPNKKSHAK